MSEIIRKFRKGLLPITKKIRYVNPIESVDFDYKKSTYYELQEIQTDTGIVQELVEVEYPVTPESVQSYVDSTNFKRDLDASTAQSGGQNLGDVTDLQDLLSLDKTELNARLEKLKEVQNAVVEQLKKVESDKPVLEEQTSEKGDNI